jgi:DNA-binding beta-propeller fold protein YncE
MRARSRRPPPLTLVAATFAAVALTGLVTVLGGGQGTTPVVRTSPADARGASASERAGGADPEHLYAATAPGETKPSLAGIRERVYVPNTLAATVDVIDPKKLEVVDTFSVGNEPHHITPSWDLKRLYVNNTQSNSLTAIDPRKGKPTETIPVVDPYNLYFSPDGKLALVVAERFQRIDFRDPESWKLLGSARTRYPGIDHLDFSADGRYAIASTEFSGKAVKIDLRRKEITRVAEVGALPVDVKISPDGKVFYVANQGRHGVSIVDPKRMKEIDFLKTGEGAHGFQVSRDGRLLYVSNRLEGSISVIDMKRRRVRDTWETGGSPDMLQLSPDGRRLWASGRYNGEVYVVETRSGRLVKSIPTTGGGPHGIAYFPQPGRYSIGHNGVYR